MQVKSPLVVLSSCNTGTGTYQPGEGVLSLARAFHFAGTPSLVMSQWPVDDQAAIYLMDQFYSGISEGLNLCKALQEAKLNYLETAGKIRSNPYFWASFQLTGYPDSITIKKEGSNIILTVMILLAFLSIIISLTVRSYLKKKDN